MGLDATMPLSSQGYYVMDDQEKIFFSADLVQGAEPPPLEDDELRWLERLEAEQKIEDVSKQDEAHEPECSHVTYVNGTDVKTHGYAVTHNTCL